MTDERKPKRRIKMSTVLGLWRTVQSKCRQADEMLMELMSHPDFDSVDCADQINEIVKMRHARKVKMGQIRAMAWNNYKIKLS